MFINSMCAKLYKMNSLQDITLDYIRQHLSRDLLEHLQEKALNDSYRINDKKIKMITRIHYTNMLSKTSASLCYWVHKYCPHILLHIDEGDTYDVYVQIMEFSPQVFKNNMIMVGGSLLYDIEKGIFYCGFKKKYLWHHISAIIYETFPQKLLEHIEFTEYSENFGVLCSRSKANSKATISAITHKRPIMINDSKIWKPVTQVTSKDGWLRIFAPAVVK